MKIQKILATALLGLIAGITADADPITIPAGLNPGDQYRLVFTTNEVTTADSTDINTYNAFVSTVANSVPDLAALGAVWDVIGWTDLVSAPDNIGASSVPIYNLAGQLVASDTTSLFNSTLDNPIQYSETGALLQSTVITGFGGGGNTGGPHFLGDANPEEGSNYVTTFQWLDNTFERPNSSSMTVSTRSLRC